MPVAKVVINASPLILLSNSDLAYILPELFAEIVVPNAVWEEIMLGPHQDQSMRLLPQYEWLRRVSSQIVPAIDHWDLGAGETSVLSFAWRNQMYTAILDDMLAKKCARSFGLPTLGTGTILILAKEQGLIPSVEDALRTLQSKGLWITESVIRMLAEKAGE